MKKCKIEVLKTTFHDLYTNVKKVNFLIEIKIL